MFEVLGGNRMLWHKIRKAVKCEECAVDIYKGNSPGPSCSKAD